MQLLAARTEVLVALRQESAVQRQSTEELDGDSATHSLTLRTHGRRLEASGYFRHWTSIRQQDRCSLLHLAFVIPGEEESLPVYTVH